VLFLRLYEPDRVTDRFERVDATYRSLMRCRERRANTR